MELNTIQQDTTWQIASTDINQNFQKVVIEVEKLKNKTIKAKGYFDSLDDLEAAYPNPSVGEIAYIKNSASSTGYYIYEVVGGAWSATTIESPAPEINLEDYEKKVNVFISPTDPANNPANNVKTGDRWIRYGIIYERVGSIWVRLIAEKDDQVHIGAGIFKVYAGELTRFFVGDETIDITVQESGDSYISVGHALIINDGSFIGRNFRLNDNIGNLKYFIDVNNGLFAIKDSSGLPILFLDENGNMDVGLGTGKINGVKLSDKQNKISEITASQNADGETILTLTTI